jgi:hypothetical protein
MFLDRLMAESSGRSAAKSPRPTAFGSFQFIKSTFLDITRRHFRDPIGIQWRIMHVSSAGTLEPTMSKRFKNKLCIYCGVAKSTTADHVFARSLFLERRRSGLPKVPACAACNGAKAKLEHYLSQLLPFGGRHEDASENLATAVEARLAKNRPMQMALRAGLQPAWLADPSGLVLPTHTITIDARDLENWCVMIVKGLAWHHWQELYPADTCFEFFIPTSEGELLLSALLSRRGRNPLSERVGNGTFSYEALQGWHPTPPMSVWRLRIYGGLMLGGENVGGRSTSIGMLVAPKIVEDRVVQRMRWTLGGPRIDRATAQKSPLWIPKLAVGP